MERQFDAYKFLAACAHLTITVSEIERYIGRKSFFHTPLHSTLPLGRFPLEERHPVWYDKTRMALLPDGNKNIFIRFGATHECDRQTDGQTDRRTLHAGNSRAMHSIARQK